MQEKEVLCTLIEASVFFSLSILRPFGEQVPDRQSFFLLFIILIIIFLNKINP